MYEKKKENPFKSKCFITACAMACFVFFYVGMTLVLSMGCRKPITLDNFVTVTADCKSNRTVHAMPQ